MLRCPNCSITLTYHQRRGRHFCHYCEFSIPAPSVCPECDSPEITLLGRGTERVEEEVKELFPEARVSRMDRDTTSGRGGHARVLKGVEDGSIDILVGTQMIAKGHDFPGVTLVGVISADATLNLPDFRSAERTFQLITQVMGRAGRGDAPGKVLIQTLNPDHYAVSRAAAHDFAGFYQEELEFRREAWYPPFAHLASLSAVGQFGRIGGTGSGDRSLFSAGDQEGITEQGRDSRSGGGAAGEDPGEVPPPDPSEGNRAHRSAPAAGRTPGEIEAPGGGAPGDRCRSGGYAVDKICAPLPSGHLPALPLPGHLL